MTELNPNNDKLVEEGVKVRLVAYHDYTVNDWSNYNTDEHTYEGAVLVDVGQPTEIIDGALDNDAVSFFFVNPADNDETAKALYRSYYQALGIQVGASRSFPRWEEMNEHMQGAWRQVALVAQTMPPPMTGILPDVPDVKYASCTNPNCPCQN